MDADFAVKLSSARANSFSVLAEFFSKGLFKSEDEPRRQRSSFKRPIEKLRVPNAGAFESTTQGNLSNTFVIPNYLKLTYACVFSCFQHYY